MIDKDLSEYDMKDGAKAFMIFITLILCIALIFECVNNCNDDIREPSTPIEEIHRIDSINKVITNKTESVNKLDSIKDDTIKKVKNLSNDSTLDLFRKLVNE